MNSESKAKHTAGPWRTELGEAFNVRAHHGGIVAQIHHLVGKHGLGGRLPHEESVANARLIAEAPTLKDYLSSARVVLARMRRSMMAHPDHEVGSEFDDLTTESQILEDEIMELIRRIEG